MKEINLTQKQVAKVDDVDYEWLVALGKWQFDRYAYMTRKVNGKRRSVRMHRLVAQRMFGVIPDGLEVDHIDKDKLNNQRSNLRLLTRSQNALNTNLKREFKGVFWDKARCKWKARICHQDLGRFDSPQEASMAVQRYLWEVFE